MEIPIPNVEKFKVHREYRENSTYTLMNHRMMMYPNTANDIDLMYHLSQPYFNELQKYISTKKPDLITLQGVLIGHDAFISIPGYESIFFCGKKRTTGYVTLWNPSKLTLISQIFIDLFTKNKKIEQKDTKCALAIQLETLEGNKLTIINGETNSDDDICNLQIYIIMHNILPLAESSFGVLICGFYHRGVELMSNKQSFKLSREFKDTLKKLVFKRKQFLIEAFFEDELSQGKTLSALSNLNIDISNDIHVLSTCKISIRIREKIEIENTLRANGVYNKNRGCLENENIQVMLLIEISLCSF
ncbi:hypothetical protein SteCoe_10269 [Stentor coeruleus]|uniref:Uncharacterized protein n=1 Tax=Stentor coeruleus TaxID=5963 RepID=A0A1R2CFY8_9CILI|nr:hypothetical protein SteCoe_10269 [Stentor coeruleus]